VGSGFPGVGYYDEAAESQMYHIQDAASLREFKGIGVILITPTSVLLIANLL